MRNGTTYIDPLRFWNIKDSRKEKFRLLCRLRLIGRQTEDKGSW